MHKRARWRTSVMIGVTSRIISRCASGVTHQQRRQHRQSQPAHQHQNPAGARPLVLYTMSPRSVCACVMHKCHVSVCVANALATRESRVLCIYHAIKSINFNPAVHVRSHACTLALPCAPTRSPPGLASQGQSLRLRIPYDKLHNIFMV